MPFNKQCDIKENICKSDGPDNQCTYKPLSSLTFLYLQKKTVHFKNFSAPTSHVPRLRVRLQELQTGAESQDSQSMQQVAAMESDIEIQCIPADI